MVSVLLCGYQALRLSFSQEETLRRWQRGQARRRNFLSWDSPDSSKRHFCVLLLVLQSSSSCSSPRLSDELTTFNLRHSTVGYGNPFCLCKFCFAYWRRFVLHLNIIPGPRRARAPLTEVNCNYVDTRPLLRTFCTSSWMPKLLFSPLWCTLYPRPLVRLRTESQRMHLRSTSQCIVHRTHPGDLMKFRDEVLTAWSRLHGWLKNCSFVKHV